MSKRLNMDMYCNTLTQGLAKEHEKEGYGRETDKIMHYYAPLINIISREFPGMAGNFPGTDF